MHYVDYGSKWYIIRAAMPKKISEEEVRILGQIGRLIKVEIKNKNTYAKYVAQFVGNSESWLSQIISAKNRLQIFDLIKIAKFLKVQPGDLLPKNPDAYTKDTFDKELEKRVLDILERKKIGG